MNVTSRRGAVVALLLLTACSKSEERESYESQPTSTFEAADTSGTPAARAPNDMSAPGISVTAAPGVAFNYRYAFRLNATSVAGVQEEHAQLCEKLGIDRCRIVGMRYRLVNDRDISAMLAFKLEPTIARQFGKQAIAAVNKANGMLIDSEITGTDAGSAIEQSKRQQSRFEEDMKAIEAKLAQPGLKSAERAELQQQLDALRQSRRATQATREDNQSALATTPMVFNYGSGDLVPGFDGSSTIRRAFETAGENFMWALNIVIVLLGTLLPWILIGALLMLLFRRIKPRLTRVIDQTPEE